MHLLDRLSSRRPLVDHDGRSGAALERALLDGVTPVYVKTAMVAADAAGLLTGDARRELRLLDAGVFDRLPSGVGSAVIGVEDLGDRLVTVTRDLGPAVFTWGSRLTGDQVRTVLQGIAAVHRAFGGAVPDGLCPLATRVGLLSPANLPGIAAANAELARAVERGHRLLVELVPGEVGEVVARCLQDPELLARTMANDTTTLLHGDFTLVNTALEGGTVVPLDWGFATAGPSGLDLVTFCVGAMSNVDLDRDGLLAVAREAGRDLLDDGAFARFELWALMESGWNKALDAVDHPDPAKRAVERADLDFWVARARRALHSGAVALPG